MIVLRLGLDFAHLCMWHDFGYRCRIGGKLLKIESSRIPRALKTDATRGTRFAGLVTIIVSIPKEPRTPAYAGAASIQSEVWGGMFHRIGAEGVER